MRYAIVILAYSLLLGPLAQAAEDTGDSMNCAIGPLAKDIGGVPWLVHACADGKSLAIASAPSSPAAPFYFVVVAQGDAYIVNGDGAGNRTAAKPAFEALLAMKPEGVAALYSEVIESSKKNVLENPPPNKSLERTRER